MWIIGSILALYFTRWITSCLLVFDYMGSLDYYSDVDDYLVDVSVRTDVHHPPQLFDILYGHVFSFWTEHMFSFWKQRELIE